MPIVRPTLPEPTPGETGPYCVIAKHRAKPGKADAYERRVEHLLALARYRESGLFRPLEVLILDCAVGMSRTPVDVPNELFAKLKAHLDNGQLIELTHVIALEKMRGRFSLALGVGAAGFSEGMVCAVPELARSP